MSGFYTYIDTGTEWKSFARVNAHSMEMTFAEADELFSVTIPEVKSDVLNEGCENVEIEMSQCKSAGGSKYIQVSASGLAFPTRLKMSEESCT